MAMLAFFPWLKIKENKIKENKIDLGKVELVRFKKGCLPDENQQVYDKILGSYVLNDKYNNPINESTLLILKDKCEFQDFTEEEINYLFSISEIIAFSGLSKRQFFINVAKLMGYYCNRDDFTFIIKSFIQDPINNDIVTRPRRRDLFSELCVSDREVIPSHVIHSRLDLDIPLIRSLMTAQEKDKEKWKFYEDAIFSFNHANTDSYTISEYQEVVLMVSAFERLLECEYGRADPLVKEFLDTIKPKDDLEMNKADKNVNIQKWNKENPKHQYSLNSTLREIWLRDFYRSRNDYAHGNRSSGKNFVWNAHEHLLLGSYIFPLVLKCKLEKDGFYKLTENDAPKEIKVYEMDKFNIDVFERLAGAELFKKTGDPPEWEWNKIREQYKHEWTLAKVKERLQQIKEMGGD